MSLDIQHGRSCNTASTPGEFVSLNGGYRAESPPDCPPGGRACFPVSQTRQADPDVMGVAATAGAGGYPGADDPVQKYADFPIDAERKQAVVRAQTVSCLSIRSCDPRASPPS